MEGKNNKTKAAPTYIKGSGKHGKRENKMEEYPKIFLEH